MADIQSYDTAIMYFFNRDLRNSFLDFALPWLSSIPLLVIALILFLCGYTWYSIKHKRNPTKKIVTFGIFTGLALGVNNTLTEIIKAVADKSRPYQTWPDVHYQEGGQWLITTMQDVANHTGGSSFLSGHAANSMVVTCAFIWFFAKRQYYFYALPLLVGWSRLYLGKHYISDIICGWILGFFVSFVMYKLLLKYFPQYYGPNKGENHVLYT